MRNFVTEWLQKVAKRCGAALQSSNMDVGWCGEEETMGHVRPEKPTRATTKRKFVKNQHETGKTIKFRIKFSGAHGCYFCHFPGSERRKREPSEHTNGQTPYSQSTENLTQELNWVIDAYIFIYVRCRRLVVTEMNESIAREWLEGMECAKREHESVSEWSNYF